MAEPTLLLLDAALSWDEAGVCVLPAAPDGTKRPALDWKQYQHQRPDVVDLCDWLGGTPAYDGIGIVCGEVSGNLEMFELESAAVADGLHFQLRDLFVATGLPDLWDKLQTYVEQSPAGGLHWIYRVGGAVPGNTKLARRRVPKTPVNPSGIQVLMETRGEGGWVVVAPSAGRTHPSGKAWRVLPGVTPGVVPTLTVDEHQTLHRLAATFNEADPVPAPVEPATPSPRKPGERTPGDDFNQRTDWVDILVPAGWTPVGRRGQVTLWRRPGKNVGISATTGYGDQGHDLFYVFTTSTEFESERSYSKLGAHALLHHNGDFAKAASELRRRGYGTKRAPLERSDPMTLIKGEGLGGPAQPPSAPLRPQPVSEVPGQPAAPTRRRKLVLTDAPTLVKPVHWWWKDRLPAGALALLAGREGIGKSVIAYTFVAQLTRGTLPGRWHGTPRTVIICATEDSWSHTITPRLMAAGADLSMVKRAAAVVDETEDYFLVLPEDIEGLEAAIVERGDVGLLLLDPLISRLDSRLDTHKDADVRLALEPMVGLADRTGIGILGLIHVNKGGSNDPLNALMGSRAFGAVARAVAFAIVDRDDPSVRLLGVPKNNLGRDDLPSMRYSLQGVQVADTDEGPVFAPKLVWGEEDERSVADVLMENNDHRGREPGALEEAADWLLDYLTQNGGLQQSKEIKDKAKHAGHTERTLKRAVNNLKIEIQQIGFPRTTYWALPGSQVDGPTGGAGRKTDVPGQGAGPTGEASGATRARGVSSIGPTVCGPTANGWSDGLFPVGPTAQDQVAPQSGQNPVGPVGPPPARAWPHWLPDPEVDPSDE